VKIEFDVKGGNGWFTGEGQKLAFEKSDLDKQLEDERKKTSSMEVELRAAALVVFCA